MRESLGMGLSVINMHVCDALVQVVLYAGLRLSRYWELRMQRQGSPGRLVGRPVGFLIGELVDWWVSSFVGLSSGCSVGGLVR